MTDKEVHTRLPLTISPQPESIKRVMVSRVEMMTQTEENSYLRKLKNLNSEESFILPTSLRAEA